MPVIQVADAEAALQRKVLAEAKLFDSDPEATHGLTFPMPQGMTLKALLRDYDTQRTTGRKVRCAVCPSHTPHFKGFVGELDSGQLVLIGIDCGEKYFGEGVWATMAAKLKREQDELYYRSRVPSALSQIERVYSLLVEWRRTLRFWSDFRARLNSELPTFGKALADAPVLGSSLHSEASAGRRRGASKRRPVSFIISAVSCDQGAVDGKSEPCALPTLKPCPVLLTGR